MHSKDITNRAIAIRIWSLVKEELELLDRELEKSLKFYVGTELGTEYEELLYLMVTPKTTNPKITNYNLPKYDANNVIERLNQVNVRLERETIDFFERNKDLNEAFYRADYKTGETIGVSILRRMTRSGKHLRSHQVDEKVGK